MGMPKIVDRYCALNRVSSRFIEANRPALGHDQEGQDNGGNSCNGCRSHWAVSIPWDCHVVTYDGMRALAVIAFTEQRFFYWIFRATHKKRDR